MAHFKAPKRVVFCELPKTSTGKIQKFVLRSQANQHGKSAADRLMQRSARWRLLHLAVFD